MELKVSDSSNSHMFGVYRGSVGVNVKKLKLQVSQFVPFIYYIFLNWSLATKLIILKEVSMHRFIFQCAVNKNCMKRKIAASGRSFK